MSKIQDRGVRCFLIKYIPRADPDPMKKWLKCNCCNKLFRKAEGFWIVGHRRVNESVLFHNEVKGLDKLKPGEMRAILLFENNRILMSV